jgi:large subunit ribosomal protein L17
MRHLMKVAKLNKTKSHRKALFQNLANALFKHERITTTVPKAMELRRVADRLCGTKRSSRNFLLISVTGIAP